MKLMPPLKTVQLPAASPGELVYVGFEGGEGSFGLITKALYPLGAGIVVLDSLEGRANYSAIASDSREWAISYGQAMLFIPLPDCRKVNSVSNRLSAGGLLIITPKSPFIRLSPNSNGVLYYDIETGNLHSREQLAQTQQLTDGTCWGIQDWEIRLNAQPPGSPALLTFKVPQAGSGLT